MSISFARRSNLMVPVTDEAAVAKAWTWQPDAVTLDLEELVLPELRGRAQGLVREAIPVVRKGGAEVFVRVNRDATYADLEASVWEGLTGVTLPGAEDADEVKALDTLLTEMERRRGVPQGTLQVDLEVRTGTGAWNALEMARASKRVTTLTVGETGLYRDLGLDPEANLPRDPLEAVKGRIIVSAVAAGAQPMGMSYPLSITLEQAGEEELRRAVVRARHTGFKGAQCLHPSWVKVCNASFRPTPEEVAYYRKVREVFAEGVARGLASVPLDGRMIDTPVDRRAILFLALDELCARRDREKEAAVAQALKAA
ncbi:MAG: aldolase/citrate lyase family protein [Chloroflexota bacterium]|nr:aldolase/citrate lyase family protein [Chloroflexota bacterium]